jgi:hypothetical protein
MAVVRMSLKLIDDIATNSGNMFTARRERLLANGPELGDKLYDIAMEPYREHMEALPPEFFEKYDYVHVAGYQHGSTSLRYDVMLKHKFSKPRPFPYKFPDGARLTFSNSYHKSYVLVGECWEDYHNTFMEWQDKVKAIDAEQKEYMVQVRGLLQQHSTLAPLLKQWPALWDLLPQYAKDKHTEIKERQPRAPVVKDSDGDEIEVDFNKLTAAVVAHKLTK